MTRREREMWTCSLGERVTCGNQGLCNVDGMYGEMGWQMYFVNNVCKWWSGLFVLIFSTRVSHASEGRDQAPVPGVVCPNAARVVNVAWVCDWVSQIPVCVHLSQVIA